MTAENVRVMSVLRASIPVLFPATKQEHAAKNAGNASGLSFREAGAGGSNPLFPTNLRICEIQAQTLATSIAAMRGGSGDRAPSVVVTNGSAGLRAAAWAGSASASASDAWAKPIRS